MRFDFRKAFAWFAAVSLIFWCSCERHHPGELAGEPEAHDKGDTTADQATSTTTMKPTHTAQTPEPRNSPANFFPDKPKP